MTSTPKKTIETPFGKQKVEINEWITGKDREYINAPLMKAVDAKPKMQGVKVDFEMGKFDIEMFMTESDHREIEKYVASIDGKTEDIVATVLSMHEDDTQFIKDSIKEISKKKEKPKAE